MTLHHFTTAIALSFSSWIVGMILNSLLMKTDYYDKFSSLNFIAQKWANKVIGLAAFKWIVKNTPFKFFNPKLTLKAKSGMDELVQLRKEMTFSELSHLIGFAFVAIFVLIEMVQADFLSALIIMLVNILMNLYPSLLQQENKRRIDRFLKYLNRI